MILRSFAAALRRLCAERRGNVLAIFGFALVPLGVAVGMTIDYTAAARMQTKLNAVADAATLAAVTKPMLSQSTVTAATAMGNSWYAQAPGTRGMLTPYAHAAVSSATSTTVDYDDGNIHITVTDTTAPSGNVLRVAKLTYSVASKNSFAGMLGMSAIPIGGTATAKAGGDIYYQIVFLVDVSNSMGIGGTTSDITSLVNDRQISCGFACHDPNRTNLPPGAASTWCEANPADYFCRQNQTYCPWGRGGCGADVDPSSTYSNKRKLAKAFGYKLKIDYVNDAVTSFVNALQSRMQANPSLYTASISTFGTSYARIQAPTSTWSTLSASAATIDIEVAARSPSGYPNQGWTYTSTGLQSLRTSLTNIGDGSSATSRKTFVIFLSDGVEDTFDSSNMLGQFNRLTSYNYAQQCTAMKNAGVTMFSIEAAYYPIPSDYQYNVLVRDLPSRNNGVQISDTMKGCASADDKFYFADNGPGIVTAVNNVFSSIFNTPRLTQ